MKIILGISASIAAYKAADLASQLLKSGHQVHCIMTQAACEFITPLTMQTLTRHPVLVTLDDEKQSWKPGHIELADSADLFVVAPATAAVLAHFAHGLAPDPLCSTYLALPRETFLNILSKYPHCVISIGSTQGSGHLKSIVGSPFCWSGEQCPDRGGHRLIEGVVALDRVFNPASQNSYTEIS